MPTRKGSSFAQPEHTQDQDTEDGFSAVQRPYVETPTFKLFPKFPAEIRRLIWIAAIPYDRIVEICSYEMWRKDALEVRFTSRTIVPPLLHTCHESRRAVSGANLYEKLIFGGRFTGTYVNWNMDIIFFRRPNHIQFAVQNMAHPWNSSRLGDCCLSLAVSDAFGLHTMLKDWKVLPNLQRVVVVQATPAYKSFDGPGDGNMVLLPMDEEQIATFGHWRLVNHKGALNRIAEFRKWEPRIKRVDLMTAYRGPEKRYSAKEKAERWRAARIVEVPRLWKINFNGYRVIDLRHAALDRNLTTDGQKKDLVERLQADEEIRFAQAMDEYERESSSQ